MESKVQNASISDFTLDMLTKLFLISRPEAEITLLPYYGAAKGQTLQLMQLPDGAVTMNVLRVPDKKVEQRQEPSEVQIDPNDLEDSSIEYSDNFSENIKLLQSTAMKIIELQELAKKNGKLNGDEDELYKQQMSILNQSALKLSQIQEESSPIDLENREGLSAWFERTQSSKNKNKKDEDTKKKKETEKKRKEEEEAKRKKEEEEEKRRKEEENRKKGEKEEEEEEEENEGGDDESVAVNLPPEDASVAEVKPVGLAIAGVGGVAASKPIGTAVVGPGGLAIARPVATAIAGVPPEEALAPIYGQSSIRGSKKKSKGQSNDYLSKILKKHHQN